MASSHTNVFSTAPNFTTPRTSFFGQGLGRTMSVKAFVSLRPSSVRRVGPLRIVNEKVVRINLGTTNSAVEAIEGGKPTIVTNVEGQRTTPPVVAYTKNGDRLVGQIAKRQAVVNPENTFFSVKMLIGMRMSEVDEESKQVSYKVVRDANGNVKINCPAVVDFMVEILYASATFQISGVNLIDIYCLFNRARGIKLISPEDLLQACSL
ncbi:hypothetical protein ACFX13_019071 [Malus domestica]